MNVAFPLRDGYFRPLQYTTEDEMRWKQMMVDLVDLSLQEERPYVASQYEHVDTSQWKLLREKDQLRVYRPRTVAINGGRSPQSVLAIGTIEGTLEDVIHGVHHVTTQDMRVITSFLSADALDSAVLHTFKNGTDDDPFRSLAVKWRLIQTPAGGLVKNRDGVVLEYHGIDVDKRGQRYAFHIHEAFDHPVCPPFHEQCAIRAKVHVRIIYRQVTPGRVGVYFLGDYALSGRIPAMIGRMSTAELALSIGKSVECTEAKKLTALALTSSPVLNSNDLRKSRHPNVCTICNATPGLLSTRHTALCDLCGSAVCAKCRSKKHLLSDDKKIPVTCCKKCIVAARNLTLDPTLPLRLVSADRWRNQNTLEGGERLWERECRLVEQHSISSRGSSDGPSSVRSRKASEFASGRGRPKQSSIDSVGTAASTLSHESLDLSYVEDLTASQKRSASFPRLPTPQSKYVMTQPDDHSTLQKRSASVTTLPSPQPTYVTADHVRLWRQMNELRLAAEVTYQITRDTNRRMTDGKAYA